MDSPEHLYIHLPFCRSRCRYCAFPSVAVATVPEKNYGAALLAEFSFRRKRWSGRPRPLATLYFGGGTPSLFSPSFFSDVIEFFAREPGFTARPEITLEANPADIQPDKVSGYRAAGINRISLGAQTFNTEGLKLLGRRHDAAAVSRAVSIVRQVGIVNLSLDLIYAWPGQKLADLNSDLQHLNLLAPEHLSAYTLSFEPGCALTKAVAAGEIVPVGEDLQLEMMDLLEDKLDKNGLCRYEVSNFSRGPELKSRHNLAYWQLKDFIGLGAGACGSRRCRQSHAYWAERYVNTPEPALYMQQLSCPKLKLSSSPSWFTEEIINRDDSFSEALMMGLRLRSGVDLDLFAHEYGSDKVAEVVSRARLLGREGMVELTGSRLRITDRGMHLTDAVTCNLLMM